MEYPEYFGEVPEEVSDALFVNCIMQLTTDCNMLVFVSIETLQNCPDQLSPSSTGEECVY